MADLTHYNYHYSCCGATQRLCVRCHTNNTNSTINLFAGGRAETWQEVGNEAPQTLGNEAPPTLYPVWICLITGKQTLIGENYLAQVTVPGSQGERTPRVTNIAARHP